MSAKDIRARMSQAHEKVLAESYGGSRQPGSGNQWQSQTDVRTNRYAQAFAFAKEGKATLGETISVSRKMLAKLREQAGPERPMLSLCWWDSERLRHPDIWDALPHEQMVEVIEEANAMARMRALARESGGAQFTLPEALRLIEDEV